MGITAELPCPWLRNAFFRLTYGSSTPLLKRGNDKADELATEGVESHVEGLLQLACFYAAKQRAYTRFVIRIHAMFCFFLQQDKHQLKEKLFCQISDLVLYSF